MKKVFIFALLMCTFLAGISAENHSIKGTWKNDNEVVKIKDDSFEYKNKKTGNYIVWNSSINGSKITVTSVKKKTISSYNEINSKLYNHFYNYSATISFMISEKNLTLKTVDGDIQFTLDETVSNVLKIAGAAAAVVGTAVLVDRLTFSDAEFESVNRKALKATLGN